MENELKVYKVKDDRYILPTSLHGDSWGSENHFVTMVADIFKDAAKAYDGEPSDLLAATFCLERDSGNIFNNLLEDGLSTIVKKLEQNNIAVTCQYVIGGTHILDNQHVTPLSKKLIDRIEFRCYSTAELLINE